MIIIDGKSTAEKIKSKLKMEVERIKKNGVCIKLVVVLVGEDYASQKYVASKEKACLEVGIESEVYRLRETTTEEELIELIQKLNRDDAVTGILVQLPLPKQIREIEIMKKMDPQKDVDGFHPENVGLLHLGMPYMIPCTPLGIVHLLEEYQIQIEGKNCVILGRSNIVGKPMASLLIGKNGTVTVCHSKTKNLEEVTREADILIAAIGKPRFVKKEMVRQDAVLIDVGINKNEEGKTCGDVDFEDCSQKASHISKVPGGVGPMTIVTLLENCVEIAKRSV